MYEVVCRGFVRCFGLVGKEQYHNAAQQPYRAQGTSPPRQSSTESAHDEMVEQEDLGIGPANRRLSHSSHSGLKRLQLRFGF